jgi:hypothetical protein
MFHDVPMNRSVSTEDSRGLTSYKKRRARRMRKQRLQNVPQRNSENKRKKRLQPHENWQNRRTRLPEQPHERASKNLSCSVVQVVVQVVLQLNRRSPNLHLGQPQGDGKSASHRNLNSTYCAQASDYYNTTKSHDNSYCTWLCSLISILQFL